jgi:predicted transposase/invertase (TIGR01784 family)
VKAKYINHDLKGVIDTSFEEGEKVGYDKGKAEKAREMAKTMKIKGYPIEDISELTQVPKEEIEKLT